MTLSFYKALVKIIFEIRRKATFCGERVRIRGQFIGLFEKQFVNLKCVGRLGIKDIGTLNKAFFINWKWRILKDRTRFGMVYLRIDT